MSWVTEGLEFVPVSSTRHHIIPTIILVYNLISLPTIIKLCSVIRNIQTLQNMHQNCCVLGCWVLFQCFQHSCCFSSGKVLTNAFILSSAWSNGTQHGSEHFKPLFKGLSFGSPRVPPVVSRRALAEDKGTAAALSFWFFLLPCGCLPCRTSSGFPPADFWVAKPAFLAQG